MIAGLFQLLCLAALLGVSLSARAPDLLASISTSQHDITRLPHEQTLQNLLSPLSQVKFSNHTGSTDVPSTTDPWVSTVFSAPGARKLPALHRLVEQPLLSEPTLDMAKAMLMARLQSISYCDISQEILDWNCTRCTSVDDTKPQSIIFDEVWDVLAYMGYQPTLNAIFVVFRGTDSANIWNWYEDFKTWKLNYMVDIPEGAGAKIHAGFWQLWSQSILEQSVTDNYLELKKQYPNAAVYIAGHSMGAALAQFCAMHLKLQHGENNIHLYTFGSPRAGNLIFAELVGNSTVSSWRFTHNRDIVPSIPLQVMGYHHIAREVWLVDVEDEETHAVDEKVIICDDSGEDPSCHNGMCRLGICTSFADHLIYLNIHLYRDPLEC